MTYHLSQDEYDRIDNLSHLAIAAPNKREGEKYIQQICYVCPDLCGAARNIVSEVYSYAKAASGRVADKDHWRNAVEASLYKLHSFIGNDDPGLST